MNTTGKFLESLKPFRRDLLATSVGLAFGLAVARFGGLRGMDMLFFCGIFAVLGAFVMGLSEFELSPRREAAASETLHRVADAVEAGDDASVARILRECADELEGDVKRTPPTVTKFTT